MDENVVKPAWVKSTLASFSLVPVKRMTKAWPNAHLIHLPVHASWLDQAEIYFSVVQRKVLTPSDFTDLGQIRDRLTAFQARYNAVAKPFSWRFTRTDLDDLSSNGKSLMPAWRRCRVTR